MKSIVPYVVPDHDVNLNSALLVLVLHFLAKSERGKLLLNNERLLIFLYLVKNPVALSNVLTQLGRQGLDLDESESYSINSISLNFDPLFDNDWLKSLLVRVSAKGLLQSEYRKVDGFMYYLSDQGNTIAEKFDGEYFGRIRGFLKSLIQIRAEPTRNLNQLLNNIFKR
ncbi:ABC-three component system middle component 4 [Janthinobacterium fluminis]|uniref:Uncharacterized protein n=1 Tax=Janthinobacterium fluminis TaxID=2987524 RepID=A0ABT5JZI0_9BURK|nr:ABC-three component system middle component 4 [Janthinobacterium fluminis]MDC8758132.1 hypothetical protein [Janthinobacterium fluminis]